MSKFIDRLKQLTEGSPQPMGFRSLGRAQVKPKIQLIAALARETAENPTDPLKEADAGLVRLPGAASAETIKKLCVAADIPWGVWTEGNGTVDLQPLMEAGADFIIFPPGASLAGLLEQDTGKIIEVESSLNDTLVRSLNGMPVDGVLVSHDTPGGRSLTWQDLMLSQRFAGIVTRPVLVQVPLAVTAKELQSLWEAGVDGVVVSISTPQAAEGLKTLREIITGLDYPAPPHHERGLAFAPRVHPGPEAEEEGEEEDDE